MADPTKVILVQNTMNQVTSVKIGALEFPVRMASPTAGPGCTDLVLSIPNVVIEYTAAIQDKAQS
jgi:hypothetical protein